MSRLDVEFFDDLSGFLSVHEDKLERKIKVRIENGDFTDLSGEEYEQLSEKRKTALEWFPFNKGDSVLELGAGMGAITEFLAEKGCTVTGVEIKKARAQIASLRISKFCSANVVCDNPVLFSSSEKFDYVLIHDIWGYIKKYDKSEDAYEKFLKRIKNLWNEKGHIFLFADNRFALKYFSGSIDEYAKKMFVGIEGYKNYSYIETFSKQQLINMFDKCEMPPYLFYYINSDYYFTDKIYSDYSLKFIKYKKGHNSTSYNSFTFFDESIVYDELQNNKIIDKFTDCFLIDFFSNKTNDWRMVYYNSNIYEQERKGISLWTNGLELVQRVYCPESEEYIQEEITDWNRLIEPIKNKNAITSDISRYEKKKFNFPYVNQADILKIGMAGSRLCSRSEERRVGKECRL